MRKTATKKKRRAITLIEMLIVISLISIITGALALNYQGSIDRGRALKTKELISRIEAILNLHLIDSPGAITSRTSDVDYAKIVQASALWKGKLKQGEVLKDGWNKPFIIKYENDEVSCSSPKFDAYVKEHPMAQ